MAKRVVLVNPDEPRAGDYAFSLYDNAHPINGDPETIERMKTALRGLRGEEVTMVFKGHRVDSDSGETKRFRVTRTFTLNRYSDVFGPGSAYASAAHYARDKYSSDELLMDSIEIEDSNGEDSEYDE